MIAKINDFDRDIKSKYIGDVFGDTNLELEQDKTFCELGIFGQMSKCQIYSRINYSVKTIGLLSATMSY